MAIQGRAPDHTSLQVDTLAEPGVTTGGSGVLLRSLWSGHEPLAP